MKTKLVLWGRNAQDERVLIALRLQPKANKVDLYTFPEAIATEDFSQKMLNEWRTGVDVPFPEGHTHLEKELSVTESLLPEDLKVERSDLINRAQTEWHFIVLSSKLNETYQAELQDLKERVEQLSSYSGDVWEELKGFWAKVQEQMRERNLFREHADELKNTTNDLFGKMKEMRKTLDKEFQTVSEQHLNELKGTLGEIKERLEKGLNLNGIFEDLKNVQRRFRDTKLTRDHRSSVWDQLDGLFKEVKTRRYGGDSRGGDGNSSPSERLKRRYDGLINALSKMEQSINRDKKELDFQDKRVSNSSVGQLEAQLREAKMMMIKERIRSKEEKLGEMLQTKTDLERRMESQKEKDAQRAEKDKVRAAKEAAAQKIKAEIQQAEAARAEDAGKLEKAAEALKGKKKVVEETTTEEPKAEEETVVEKIATTIEETLEDVVDTVKAVAHVVSEKIDEAVEQFNEKETEAETKEESVSETTKVADFTAKDDLKTVEGIGPKIEELLNSAGITTFAGLAATDADKIRGILSEAGNRYKAHDPTTWPKQSDLAANGKWDELKKWQDELDGGKVVKASGEEE